ncbi:hypothetical protein JCM17795_00820 [Galenea microaerophila]
MTEEKTDAQIAAEQAAKIPTPEKPQPKPIAGALNTSQAVAEFLQKNGKIPSPEDEGALPTADEVAFEVPEKPENSSESAVQWIWVEEGLQSIWQNASAPAWQLWLNILKAFHLQPEQTQFFDPLQLNSEAHFEHCVEQVIAGGVEHIWVSEEALSSPLVEWLAEGVEVVSVPSLHRMLEEGQAKQQFFETVCRLETV